MADKPTDGHPLDQIHYREYKILLRPERFTSPESYVQYWEAIQKVAKKFDVEIAPRHDGFKRLVREVLFYDTMGFDLYKNAFILRKRTFYTDGWPEKDHELTFKFRHKDIDAAAAISVDPQLPGESAVKFKEEVLPLKDKVGEIRSLYSHNCVLTSPNIVLNHAVEDIAKVFPTLHKLEVSPETPIDLVNNVAVEEVQVEPGDFHFGHGMEAKATIAIWRNRALENSLVGEFAFQAKFHRYDDMHHKALKRSEDFYRAVQTQAEEWVQLGTTKTALVYGMGNIPVPTHE